MTAFLLWCHRREDGQVLVLVAVFLMGLVAVAGLVADGGLLLAQRRDLQNTADAAAAAGAMRLDEATYRASSGSVVVLDQDAAYTTAIEYLLGENGVQYAVDVTVTSVEVQLARNAQTAFLRVLGIDGVAINAHAVAEPRSGIAGGP
ncbi:MAG: hypothetical protein C4558_08980 [Dehalococcoidia bacterium]|nr:MAG: hypothetical protein C4558_08980 [Dehalococcoidia bacterium]